MANPPNGEPLHKIQVDQGLGKSTLITPTLSIPMPQGAAAPRPPATAGGQRQGQTGQTAQAANRNG